MALVPYKRPMYGSAMPMTRFAPRSLSYIPRAGFTSSGMMRRSSKRRRSKFDIGDTRSNPVYPRPEVKFLDVNVGTLAAPIAIDNTGAGGTFAGLLTIPIGANSGNRVGTQVSTKNCYYQFVINFGGTAAPIVVRHVLLWDKQSNLALPVAGDIFSNTASLVVSPMNLFNKERFVVLADDRVTLSPQGENIRCITGFRTINQKTQFNGTTGTIPMTGNLIVFFVSDEPVGGTAPFVYGTWRTRYIDN